MELIVVQAVDLELVDLEVSDDRSPDRKPPMAGKNPGVILTAGARLSIPPLANQDADRRQSTEPPGSLNYEVR